MSQMIFVDLPVADLERSRTFFTALGYPINDAFSDEHCLALSVSLNGS